MTVSLAILALLAGWCGTPWPRKWPPIPIPDPEPDPICPVCGNIISSLAGLLGGYLVITIWPTDVSVASIGIGGFIAGAFIGDIYRAVVRKG